MADAKPTSTTGQPPTGRPLPQKGRAPGAGSAQIATPPEVPEDLRSALEAGQEMGRRITGFDWGTTSLGPMAGWPQSTRTLVAVCVTSRFPIVLWFGPDLVTIYNDGYAPMLGDKHPGSLGRPGPQVWPEIWDTIGPMFQAVLERGEATWSDDQFLPLVRKGYPEECYFTFTYSPIRDEDGEVGGVFCAVTETTQRVIGERRLRTLRELAGELSDARAEEDAFAIARRVLVRNPTDIPFALLYRAGARGPEPAGRTGPAGDDDPGAWPLPQSGWVKVEKPRRALVVPLRDLGEERCVGWLVAGVSDLLELDDDYRSFLELAGGQLAAALANARSHELERQRAEALAELDRAKTTFFSNVSHELRTPLALILGPTEDALATGSTERNPGEAARVHAVVRRNALRLQKLVEGMLDFSRLEAGRMQADLRPTDLAAFTTDLASQFRSAVERAGLKMQIGCPPLPAAVRVDRDMWEKIVLNLLSNALKFTFEGTLTVRLAAEDDHVVLTVSDTGVGIPSGELPRLFERFHRVQGTQSRTHEGTGIGLALVHELVRLHGGEVSVKSEEGRGSIFRVVIPVPEALAITEDDRAGVRRAGAFVEEALRWLPDTGAETPGVVDVGVEGGGAFDPGTRVVVVDDNADMRDYLRRTLSAYWSVDVYDNGAVALEAITAAAPQLVVTDVMMPGLDGFGLLKALRDHPATQRLPVIMLSARAGEEAAVEGLNHGADDYLVKPFSSRELFARVRANLDLARLREDATRAAETQARRLAGLADAAAHLGRCRSIDECAELVTDAARDMIGAQRALCSLIQEPGRDPVILVSGSEGRRQQSPHQATGPGMWPVPLLEGRPSRLTRQELEADPAWKAFAETSDGGGPAQGLLAVAMLGLDGAPVGVIQLFDKEGDFSAEDEAVAVQLAQIAAMAIENIRLYEREHRVAETLQRALLPGSFEDLSGVAVAARYFPGGAGLAVGGDWYDVFPLTGRRLGVVVGDVVGRGVTAAAVMGQLRVALRAYALEFASPATVLACLGRLVRSLDESQMATVLYGVVDPEDATIQLASAGHPPPLFVAADGTTSFLDLDAAPPLGVLAELPPNQVTSRLEPGCAVLFYTDGLIERRGASLDDGMDALARAASGQWELEALCDRVSDLMGAKECSDDVALLGLSLPKRVAGAEEPPVETAGPAVSRTTGETDDVVVVSLSGEIDLSTVDDARNALVQAATSGATGVVIDLSDVAFMDSMGVNVLFLIARRLRDRRQHAVLVVPPGSLLRKMFSLTALDRLLPLCAEMDAAVTAAREPFRTGGPGNGDGHHGQ